MCVYLPALVQVVLCIGPQADRHIKTKVPNSPLSRRTAHLEHHLEDQTVHLVCFPSQLSERSAANRSMLQVVSYLLILVHMRGHMYMHMHLRLHVHNHTHICMHIYIYIEGEGPYV